MARTTDSLYAALTGPRATLTAFQFVASVVFLFVSLSTASIAFVAFYSAVVPSSVALAEPVWLVYGKGVPSARQEWGQAIKSKLAKSVAYDVAVRLDVPLSPENIQLGNFMASVALLDKTSTPILQVTRPATLPHQPVTLPAASDSWSSFFPLSLVRPRSAFLTPTSELVIPLLSAVPVHTLRKSWGFVLSVGREDAHLAPRSTFRAPELQVYKSALKLTARLTGFKGFMYRHPYLSYLILGGFFWTLELLAAAAVTAWWMYSSDEEEGAAAGPGEFGAGRISSRRLPGEEGLRRRTGVKAEDEDESSALTSSRPSSAFTRHTDSSSDYTREEADDAADVRSTGSAGSWRLLEEEDADGSSEAGTVRARVRPSVPSSFAPTATTASGATDPSSIFDSSVAGTASTAPTTLLGEGSSSAAKAEE